MVNIPDFTDEDYESLSTFVEKAKFRAERDYVRDNNGQYKFINALDFVPNSWSGQERQLKQRFNDFSSEEFAQIGAALSEYNQAYFTYLADGDRAKAFLATDLRRTFFNVVRISQRPKNRSSITTTANQRTSAPHTLQAIDIIDTKKHQAQFMPCIAMYDTLNMDGFIGLMEALYQDTCYLPHFGGYTKDTAVFPDGTIVYVDPGAIVYTADFYKFSKEGRVAEIARSLDLIQERSEAWNLPEQLRPIKADDTRKQDEFFPSPITQ